MRRFSLILALLMASATAAPAATYVWEMTATEDQVNNSGQGNGSTGSSATGQVRIEYVASTGELSYDLSWADLEWLLTKIHLHGPATPEQSVMPHLWNVFPEEPDVVAAGVDRTTGTYSATVPLTSIVPGPPYLVTPGILQSMVDELGYMNFHTMGWPKGEIRANLQLIEENVPLTRAHRRCHAGMHRVLERATRAGTRQVRRCVSQAANGVAAADCLASDDASVASAGEAIQAAFDTHCWGFGGQGYLRFPAFGGGRVDSIRTASENHGLSLVQDLLDGDIDTGVVSQPSYPETASCQQSLISRTMDCSAAILHEFRTCAKKGFAGSQAPAGANVPFASAQDLALCLGEDISGSIERRCDRVAGRGDRIRRALDRRCVTKGADLELALPGCALASAGPEAVHACTVAAARCAACRTGNGSFDGVERDCDVFDDDVANASCSG